MKKRFLIVTVMMTVLLSGCGAAAEKAEEPAAVTEESQDAVIEEETENVAEESKVEEPVAEEAEASEAAEVPEAATSVELTGEFASFTSTDLDGNEVDQSIISGADLTMLNIWGTFCGPCINEMPDLGELAEEYAGSGFQIIGVPIDVYDETGITEAKDIIDTTGADYLHILPSDDLNAIYLDNVQAVPTTLFIDKSGTIIDSIIGSQSKEDWKKMIDEKMQ